jgi:hypothetical protein
VGMSARGQAHPPSMSTGQRSGRRIHQAVSTQRADSFHHSFPRFACLPGQSPDGEPSPVTQRADHRASDPAERAGEGRLVPGRKLRSVPSSLERAPVGHRTGVAAWQGPAHLAAQVHQGLIPITGVCAIDPFSRRVAKTCPPHLMRLDSQPHPGHDPGNVRVHGRNRGAERNGRDGRRRVWPHAGEGAQSLGRGRDPACALLDDPPGGLGQVQRPAVVAEPRPRAEHLPPRGLRQPSHRGESAQELAIRGYDAGSLSLLQHHLADQDSVRIGVGRTPRVQIAAGPVPVEQSLARMHGRSLAE